MARTRHCSPLCQLDPRSDRRRHTLLHHLRRHPQRYRVLEHHLRCNRDRRASCLPEKRLGTIRSLAVVQAKGAACRPWGHLRLSLRGWHHRTLYIPGMVRGAGRKRRDRRYRCYCRICTRCGLLSCIQSHRAYIIGSIDMLLYDGFIACTWFWRPPQKLAWQRAAEVGDTRTHERSTAIPEFCQHTKGHDQAQGLPRKPVVGCPADR